MLIRWCLGICDRLCAVAGAFACSQVPLFYQQYAQRLAGHLAEAERQVGVFQEMALQSGKNLQEYIGKFISQSDLDFIAQGEMMQASLTRLSSLREAYYMLNEAVPWWRPYYFAKYLQVDVFDSSLRDFTPGLAINAESALYACVGMAIGYFCFQFVRLLFRGVAALLHWVMWYSPSPS